MMDAHLDLETKAILVLFLTPMIMQLLHPFIREPLIHGYLALEVIILGHMESCVVGLICQLMIVLHYAPVVIVETRTVI